MLKIKTTPNLLTLAVNQLIAAFKLAFQSTNNREFRRLKDFICS